MANSKNFALFYHWIKTVRDSLDISLKSLNTAISHLQESIFEQIHLYPNYLDMHPILYYKKLIFKNMSA